jgi:hypothetical protein
MIPPLNIRGARGFIKLSKFPPQDKRGFGGITNKWLATFITPFVPPYLKGDILEGDTSYLKGK